MTRGRKLKIGASWLVQLEEHESLDLGVVSLEPHAGHRDDKKTNKLRKKEKEGRKELEEGNVDIFPSTRKCNISANPWMLKYSHLAS